MGLDRVCQGSRAPFLPSRDGFGAALPSDLRGAGQCGVAVLLGG